MKQVAISKICCFLLCFLLSNIFLACKKNANPVNFDTGEDNPTVYLLEQISAEASGATNGSTHYFQYNDHNLIAQIKRVIWHLDNPNNNNPVRQESVITYEFEYDNKLAIKCTQRMATDSWTFEYNHTGGRGPAEQIRISR